MIIYNNRDIQLIVFRRAGSVLLTKMVLVPAALSTLLCLVFLYISAERPVVVMSSSVARVYSTILGFVIVFRTSMAFGRFFEGIAHVQMLFSKWRDAFSSLMAFTECSIASHAERGQREFVEELLLAKARLLHWFSLLSALSVQELQNQDDNQSGESNRLCVIRCPTNRLATGEVNADMQPKRRRASGVGVMLNHGAAQGMDFLDGADGSGENFVFMPVGLNEDNSSRCSFSKQSSMASMPVSFKEDTSSGAFSRMTHVSDLTTSTVLKPVHAGEADLEQRRRAICIVGEVTSQELSQLIRSDDHVLTIIKWIIQEISFLAVTGKLLIGPPILSRVYQELSNGTLAFSIAKIKIATVPFPFPFAQVLSYALYAFYVLCPFIILEIMDEAGETSLEQVGVPLLMNFLACAGYGALNEIAIELEEPFGFDANDYPVHCQQIMIVRAMEDTYFASAPHDFSISHFSGSAEDGSAGELGGERGSHAPPADAL